MEEPLKIQCKYPRHAAQLITGDCQQNTHVSMKVTLTQRAYLPPCGRSNGRVRQHPRSRRDSKQAHRYLDRCAAPVIADQPNRHLGFTRKEEEGGVVWMRRK